MPKLDRERFKRRREANKRKRANDERRSANLARNIYHLLEQLHIARYGRENVNITKRGSVIDISLDLEDEDKDDVSYDPEVTLMIIAEPLLEFDETLTFEGFCEEIAEDDDGTRT